MKGLVSGVLDGVLVFLAVSYALSVLAVLSSTNLGDHAAGADFSDYYFTSLALRKGVPMYDRAAVGEMASSTGYSFPPEYVYPPLLAVLVLPLTFLPLLSAFRVWALLNQLFMLLALAFYLKASGRRSLSDSKPHLLVFLLFIASLAYAVNIGQAVVLMFLLFALFYYCMKKNMLLAAGVFLAFSAMIKPVALLFYPYLLLRRQYRALASSFAALAALLAFSVFTAGWENMGEFTYSVLMPLLSSSSSAGAFLFSDGTGIFLPLKAVMIMLPFLLIYLSSRRVSKKSSSLQFDLEYAFMQTSLFILTPHMVYYNYIYLIIPFWILYDRRDELLHDWQARSIAMALLLLIVSPTTYVSLYAIFAFWLLLSYLMLKQK